MPIRQPWNGNLVKKRLYALRICLKGQRMQRTIGFAARVVKSAVKATVVDSSHRSYHIRRTAVEVDDELEAVEDLLCDTSSCLASGS